MSKSNEAYIPGRSGIMFLPQRATGNGFIDQHPLQEPCNAFAPLALRPSLTRPSSFLNLRAFARFLLGNSFLCAFFLRPVSDSYRKSNTWYLFIRHDPQLVMSFGGFFASHTCVCVFPSMYGFRYPSPQQDFCSCHALVVDGSKNR